MKELNFVSKILVAFMISFTLVSISLPFHIYDGKNISEIGIAHAAEKDKDSTKTDSKTDDAKESDKSKTSVKQKMAEELSGNNRSDFQKAKDKATGNDAIYEKTTKNLEKNGNKDVKEAVKDSKSGGSGKKSYASLLFDETKKNESLMYYNSQTGSGVSTVESIIDNKGKKGDGQEYAAFLQSMDRWNIYHVYTNQMDVGSGLLLDGVVKVYGGILLACMYLNDGLDFLVKMFGDLFDYLNIFKYIADDNGVIPKDSPFAILQPILNIIKTLNTTAMVVVAFALGLLFFMVVLGMGKAKDRSRYFGRGIGKIMLAIFSLVFTPLILAAFFTTMSETLDKYDSTAGNTVSSIPGRTLVDTLGWIDNSLTAAKGQKDEKSVNGGFVLLHDHEDFPKKESEVKNDIPTPDLVKYLNTGNKKDDIDGKEILSKWTRADTMNATDIDSIYSLSKNDKKFWWSNDEKRAFQFKLAPSSNTVKVFGGKEMISMDLSDVSIKTASLAGNTAFGQFLNAVKMGTMIIGTTIVLVILYLSMFVSFIRSLWESLTHWILSNFLSISAIAGTLVVMGMMAVSVGSVLLLAPLFNDLVKAIDGIASHGINKYIEIGGIGKQLLSTIVTILVMAVAMLLTIKGRKAIIEIARDFFNRILSRLNMNQPSLGGKMNPAQKSLNSMADDSMYGLDASERGLTQPLDAAKDKLDEAKGLFSDKAHEVSDGLKGKMSDAYDSAKEKASEFAGSFKSEDIPDDAEAQGDAIDDSIQNGLKGLSSNDISNNLDKQDESVNEAFEANKEMENAQKELNDAQKHLDELKNNGGSQADIDSAERNVEQAQNKFNDALRNSQRAAKDMADSGASVEDIAHAQKDSADDYVQATNDIRDAERELNALKSEREQLSDMGATPSELRSIDNKIGKAEDQLESAKSRQGLAKEAYDASVGNGQVAKDSRNDLVSAQQAEREAIRSLSNAQEHGNLTSSEHGKLKDSANNISSDMSSLLGNMDNQIRNIESQQGALEFMNNNGGSAFVESDFKSQEGMLQKIDNDIDGMQQSYQKAQNSKASKSQLTKMKNQIDEATAQKAQFQSVMESMNSGHTSDSAFSAQQQMVEQAFNDKDQAEQQLIEIQKRENSGDMIDRNVMKSAQANVKNANKAYTQATRTLKGLEAQRVAGSNNLSSSYIDSKKQSNNDKLQGIQKQYDTLKAGNDVSETLGSGGFANINDTAKLSRAQRIVQENASKYKDDAVKTYEGTAKKVEDLKAQEARGMPVSSEVNRMQNSLKRAKKEMNSAIAHEKFVRKQGTDIRASGKTMKNNIQEAQSNKKEKIEATRARRKQYDNVLRSGGYTSDQLNKFKQNITSDKTMFEDDKMKLKRDRREKVQSIERNKKRSESLMNK